MQCTKCNKEIETGFVFENGIECPECYSTRPSVKKELFEMKQRGLTTGDIVEWVNETGTHQGFVTPYGHPFAGWHFMIVPLTEGNVYGLNAVMKEAKSIRKIGDIEDLKRLPQYKEVE